jgi:hypothetical protein
MNVKNSKLEDEKNIKIITFDFPLSAKAVTA